MSRGCESQWNALGERESEKFREQGGREVAGYLKWSMKYANDCGNGRSFEAP